MIVWLIGVAWAQDVPTPPVRADDEEHDCRVKQPLLAGSTLDCDVVGYPPAYGAYLEEVLVYSGQLHVHLVAARSIAEADARAAADQLQWRDDQLAAQLELRQPRPVLEVLAYVGVGVGLTLGAAWSLGQITP